VYITGNPLGKLLTTPVSKALQQSGIYAGGIESIDRYAAGATGDRQISNAGAKAGVHYVFVIDVATPISVRIIDVETAGVPARISIDGKMSAISAAGIAKKIVDFILKSGPKPEPGVQAAGGRGAETEGDRGRGGMTTLADSWGNDGKKSTYNLYFAVRWMPVVTPAYSFSSDGFSANIEAGVVWGEGTFLGVDFGGGHGESGYNNNFDDSYIATAELFGVGLNFGNAYNFLPGLDVVYGVSVGHWVSSEQYKLRDSGSSNNMYFRGRPEENYRYYYFGPFIRSRYSFIELYNRLLIGETVCYQMGIGLIFGRSRSTRW